MGLVGLACVAFVLSACSKKKQAMQFEYNKDSQFKAEDFKTPPADYRIVPFWSWNETMEPQEIRRQLRLMKEAGWGGSMIHSRTGLITDYLGEDWFKAVEATLNESKKLGMLVWLYDEDKWPSGFSGGTVLKKNLDYAVKMLTARPVGEKMGTNAKPIGEPKDGIQVYEVVAKQGNAQFNGTSYVDTMFRDAMETFKKEAYDSYYERYKKDFGNLIVAEFTDEPAMSSFNDLGPNGVPYSREFLEAFKKEYAFDPIPHFHKLFVNCDGAKKFRLQYFRTLNKLFETNFFKLLGDACAQRGIALTGHSMAEDSPLYQHTWSGRIMPYYRHMGIPGIDHLARHVGNPLTGKQCHSVCNQYGKTRMLSEMYGVSGGSLTFEDRQWITYQQMIVGVNVIVPHLSLFSMTGCRKRDYPQNINYQQSWWKINSAIDIPLARACYALAQGKYAADVLLISPQESIASIWRVDPKVAGSESYSKDTEKQGKEIERVFNSAIDALLSSQLTFDLGDEQLLEEDGFVDGKKIGIKQMSYKAVVLPEGDNMRPATLKRLKEFSANGGVILRVGTPAKYLDGEKSEELDAFMKSVKLVKIEDLGKELKKLLPSLISIEDGKGDMSKVWAHIRNYNDGSRLVMLTNLSRFEKFSGDLNIRGSYSRTQLLDIETGDINDVYAERVEDALKIPVSLETAGAIFLRVSNEIPVKTSPDKIEKVSAIEITNWKAERLDDNSMTLDYASFLSPKGSVDGEIPAIEISRYLNSLKYDGELTVKYAFQVKNFDKNRKLWVVIEYPERAVIKVNGKEVKYAGLPFWHDFRWLPIDITGLVEEGKNVIETYYKDFKYGDGKVHKPQWRRYGTEIEQIYLVGDFSVVSKDTGVKPANNQVVEYKCKPIKNFWVSKNDLAITNPTSLKLGDQTMNGLPFYCGRLAYTAKLNLEKPAANERILLKLGDLDCPVAEVLINGERVGVIKNEPFELDITNFAKGKEAEIKVILYASLRNLADGLHNYQGELYSIWLPHYRINDLPIGSKNHLPLLKKFVDGSWKSKHWVKDYCQVAFGDVEKIELIKIRKN